MPSWIPTTIPLVTFPCTHIDPLDPNYSRSLSHAFTEGRDLERESERERSNVYISLILELAIELLINASNDRSIKRNKKQAV